MIKPGEIQKKATAAGVRDPQIEKDYILSWILKGISQQKELSKLLVFKGGTVLKKFYFEDYRFSEDLDFTITNTEITNEQLFQWFQEVFKYTKEEANIPLEIIDDNKHEDGSINFYIGYVGPLGGHGGNKKVKVDISKSELIVFKSVTNISFEEYSDLESFELKCYPLEEVLVEKMRSIMQRMQARDYYDIWYLMEEYEMNIAYYMNEFEAKCKHKGLDPKTFLTKLEQRIPQYKARWISSMKDQIKKLPDFEQVDREVQRQLKKIK
ncbi:MAG: nucleotidyl transferase AbiEii/AbiGii toxin family protein [Prolixibacteraceae bacterium]|nr:nucleotidyl transferase AbiEii/AbiGii toxin family protein [Prolixibacteraceae bacterium]